jgi:hypothetical protein
LADSLASIENHESGIRLRLPVTVLLERRMVERKFWKVPTWKLTGVAVGEQLVLADRSGQKVRDTADGEEFSWTGYHVTLYKDACERYWHALIGDKPKVYVVCREGVDESDVAIEPMVVTIDYDEATAFVETDELVLSSEIPGELYRYMEAFVLQHYKPEPFRKRKRTKWVDSSSGKPA